MNVLMSKLRLIEQQCSPDAGKKKKKIDPTDQFAVKKKEIADGLKHARESLKERDELLKKKGTVSAATTVELSSRIRLELRKAKTDAEELEEILENMKKKIGKKPSEEQQEMIKAKEDQINAVYEHIEEVGRLEKRRHAVGGDARSKLLAGGAAAGTTGLNLGPLPDDPTMTGLDPIDDETAAELQVLEQGNEDIDRDLDLIATGVGQLREIALTMGHTLDQQNAMIDETNAKVDNTTSTVKAANKKLNKILADLGTDKMCTYILLFLFLFVFNKSQGR